MKKDDYYSENLSALKLKKCYDIASPRIQQYLKAEIDFVKEFITPNSKVLELGCGYGRVLKEMAKKAKLIYGIDSSEESIEYAKIFLEEFSNIELLVMNAKSLKFEKNYFDLVIAIQNGISAFKVNPKILIAESLRVLKKGGKLLLSTYSEKIWDARLDWFEEQAKAKLLGEIDYQKTGKGVIVCKDGFKATTFEKEDFIELVNKMNLKAEIKEIDRSSLFCIITKKVK